MVTFFFHFFPVIVIISFPFYSPNPPSLLALFQIMSYSPISYCGKHICSVCMCVCVHVCVHACTYLFLKTTCSLYIMWFLYKFSEMTSWCWITSWFALPWVRPALGIFELTMDLSAGLLSCHYSKSW